MERYRIIRGEGCNGCIPIIIYWVQVRKDKCISYEWVNVKGFDTYKRAEELLNVLKGGIDYDRRTCNIRNSKVAERERV